MDVLTVLTAAGVLWLFYRLRTWWTERARLSQLTDKFVMITGCDSGFGNLLAKRLDQLGLRVFAGCLTDAGVSELRQSCSARLQPLKMDVTNSDSVKTAFEVVKAAVGSKGLWGLVNNAGISGQVGPAEWMTVADYRAGVLNVNLLGLIDVTQTFFPLLKKSRGRIVNIASAVGRLAMPTIAPYAVTKFAVEGFSDALRRSIRCFGVTVHIIEPGFFRTNITTDMERVSQMYDDIWARQSSETKAEYGEMYIQEEKDKALRAVEGQKKGLQDPAEVVTALEHALCAVRPRSRYVVGRDARWFFIPFTWLPTDLGDVLSRSLVPQLHPVPAAYRAS